MRGFPFAVLLALIGCNPGISPPQGSRNETVPARNQSVAAPQAPANDITVAGANAAEEALTPTPEPPPGIAEMSPYRRREYERGWRDCMSGNFDGERQGESYRIGCMAAEDAKQRHSGR